MARKQSAQSSPSAQRRRASRKWCSIAAATVITVVSRASPTVREREGWSFNMRMMSRLSGKRESRNTEGPQLDVRVVQTNKVFKTHKGGKTASWSILVVVGDNKGSVGVGLGKARGIPDAIRKAEEAARKSMFPVPMIGATIPHVIVAKHGTSRVILRPAAAGTGVKAGGAVRACLEACGIHDVLAK